MEVIDVADVLARLAVERQVFHSEKDFQVSLGIQIGKTMGIPVRLESRPLREEKMYLDIYLPTMRVAIELKYKTRRLDVELYGEQFWLLDQRAHDNGRYDFLADLERLEYVVKKGAVERGIAILLTNDPLYWTRPRLTDTVDAAFQLEDGRVLRGELAWRTAGDRGPRETPIALRGSHDLVWRDYAVVNSGRPGTETVGARYRAFRYLAVELTGDRLG